MGSELITEDLKKQIRPLLQKMKKQVVLRAVLDESDKIGTELAGILKEMASLSDRLTLELLKPEGAEGAEHLPVTKIYYENGVYSGVCFHGIPGGKEINSFLAAVCYCGGAAKEVEKKLKTEIDKIVSPKEIKVFVSLACHHCPHVVAACQKIAFENPYVSAAMYDARLYPDLIEQYQIERVPMTVINDETVIMGQKTIEEFVQYLQK